MFCFKGNENKDVFGKSTVGFPIFYTQIHHTSVSFLLKESNGNSTTLLDISPLFFLGYFINVFRENDMCICQKAAVTFPLFWTAQGVSRCSLSRAISHRSDSWLKWPFVTCRLKNQNVKFPRDKTPPPKKTLLCFCYVFTQIVYLGCLQSSTSAPATPLITLITPVPS